MNTLLDASIVSLRDYLAIMYVFEKSNPYASQESNIKFAYEFADAMLAEREK